MSVPVIEAEALTKSYGRSRGIEDGIEPLAFGGVTIAACVFAAVGAWLFDRRDVSA